jgi:hypothetical protein
MKVWALFSARVDPYSERELVALFADRAVAEAVRDGLIGNPVWRNGPGSRVLGPTWHEDPDGDELLDDLHVRPVELH